MKALRWLNLTVSLIEVAVDSKEIGRYIQERTSS